jgi:hypothetical protein
VLNVVTKSIMLSVVILNDVMLSVVAPKLECLSPASLSSLVKCLWGKSGAQPSEAPFKCSTLGLVPSLPANVRVDWKTLPGTNTQAYHKYP